MILALTIFYSLLMFFAWFMPKNLKNRYNRGFKRLEDKEYSERELMNMIAQELNNKKKE